MSKPGTESAAAPSEATPPEPGDAAPTLKILALKASFWTLGGNGAAQLLRLGSNLVLTRLLFPKAFGLMVVVNACVQGLQLFSDVGLRPSIVQHRRGDDQAFLDTAWTLQVVRGALLWIVSILVAWPVARFCEKPEATLLIPVVGLTALFSGFNSTKLLTCDRHLSLGRTTLITLGSSILGVLVMIVWALLAPSVWCLVGGGLMTSAARAVLSHVAIPGPGNRFRWEGEAGRDLITFGRWVFLSTLTTFLALQLDRLLFARMIPAELLGVYSVGLMISRLPPEVLGGLGSSVAMPAYSRLREREGGIARVYGRVRLLLLLLGGAGISFMILLGPAVIRVLYDQRYQAAGWILQLLAVGAWFQVLATTDGDALLALGQPKWIAACNVAKVVAMLVLLPVGFHFFGPAGALAGMSLAELPKYLVVAGRARRCGLPGWGVELGMTAAIAVCGAAALGLGPAGPERLGPWARLVLASACLALVWVPIARVSVRAGGLLT